MRVRTYPILLACLLALCGPGSAGASADVSPLILIQRCLGQLQAANHAGKHNQVIILSDACPQLSLSLENPQLAQLEPPLLDITSIHQLNDAQRSLQSRLVAAAGVQAPATHDVRQILKQVYVPQPDITPNKNFMEKIMSWLGDKLQEFLKRHHWFADNFHMDKKTGARLLKGILSTVVVLLVVMILYIFVNEIRLAGITALLKRRRLPRTAPVNTVAVVSKSAAVDLDIIRQLPTAQQIPALLRYTLRHLIDKKILPRRYNLTNREFLGLIRQKLPAAGNDFEQLVYGSERVTYGKQRIDTDDAQQLFAYARNIERLPVQDSP